MPSIGSFAPPGRSHRLRTRARHGSRSDAHRGLAALIVLGDERRREVPSRLDQRSAAERRRSPRRVEAVPGQRTVLTDLADLEFEDPATVDDATPCRGEPVEDRSAVVGHMRVRARVRRGRQARPEEPGRGRGREVDPRLGQQPFDMTHAEAVEGVREWGDPVGIVMDDVDRRFIDGGQDVRTHCEPSLVGYRCGCARRHRWICSTILRHLRRILRSVRLTA
jgi:hypothetical protein